MTNKDVAVKFVSKLVQLTQEGKLNWRGTAAPVRFKNVPPSAAFLTEIDGKSLRIYKTRNERTVLSGGGLLGTLGTLEPQTKTVVTMDPVLEVLDKYQQTAYAFEETAGLDDLYEAAAFASADVNELIDSVLRR